MKRSPQSISTDALLDVRAQIQELRSQLEARFVEREEFVAGALAALLAREHVLLVGPPGTAKSTVIQSLCQSLTGARYFHWLLTRFTTPEELFGPVSLRALENDHYRRVTDGKLPQAHVAFLDEIFKANSAILNALLSLIEERVYHNDSDPTPVPLQTLFGASNTLPDSRDLDCLFDRFLFRYRVDYIEESEGFRQMLAAPAENGVTTRIGLDELAQAQAETARVDVGDDALGWLTEIRTRLRARDLVVSDRRFRAGLNGLRARAYLAGRSAVEASDLLGLRDMLWTRPEERVLIEQIVTSVVAPRLHAALQIEQQADDVAVKALQPWFDRDEERAALLEAGTKIRRLAGRLAESRCEQESGGDRRRVEEIRAHLKRLLDDVESRQYAISDGGTTLADQSPAESGNGSRERTKSRGVAVESGP